MRERKYVVRMTCLCTHQDAFYPWNGDNKHSREKKETLRCMWSLISWMSHKFVMTHRIDKRACTCIIEQPARHTLKTSRLGKMPMLVGRQVWLLSFSPERFQGRYCSLIQSELPCLSIAGRLYHLSSKRRVKPAWDPFSPSN
jgi:hypothetical protein